MREIEVKARVQDADALLAALKSHGVVLSEPLKQHDIVWFEQGSDPKNMVGRNVLRIRTENDAQATFALKQTVADLDKIEHETIIDNPEEMRAAIELMHYELYVEVVKLRRKAKFGDYEICVDEVSQLGTFIEIEKLCDETADGDAVRDELWQVLAKLGISGSDEVTQGYDILMRESRSASNTVQPVQIAVVYLRRDNEILMARKQRGFGAGKLMGAGGKVEPGETVEQCLLRETREELGIVPMKYEKVAVYTRDCSLSDEPFIAENTVYICTEWQGEPTESDEAKELAWYPIDDLPFDDMTSDRRMWLPQVLAGEKIKGTFAYDQNDQLTTHSIEIVEEL